MTRKQKYKYERDLRCFLYHRYGRSSSETCSTWPGLQTPCQLVKQCVLCWNTSGLHWRCTLPPSSRTTLIGCYTSCGRLCSWRSHNRSQKTRRSVSQQVTKNTKVSHSESLLMRHTAVGWHMRPIVLRVFFWSLSQEFCGINLSQEILIFVLSMENSEQLEIHEWMLVQLSCVFIFFFLWLKHSPKNLMFTCMQVITETFTYKCDV